VRSHPAGRRRNGASAPRRPGSDSTGPCEGRPAWVRGGAGAVVGRPFRLRGVAQQGGPGGARSRGGPEHPRTAARSGGFGRPGVRRRARVSRLAEERAVRGRQRVFGSAPTRTRSPPRPSNSCPSLPAKRGGGSSRSGSSRAGCASAVFVAWQGRVLGCAALEKTATDPPGGPATVVTCIECPQLVRMAHAVVERTGATGLGSVDAIVDANGVPWFVEVNPRYVPPMAPSRLAGFHVGRLLRSALEGRRAEPWSWPVGSVYALFPQEVLRDPESEWLAKAVHDVPEDDPPLVAAYGEYAEQERRRRAAQRDPLG
jgi:hypothetical protein